MMKSIFFLLFMAFAALATTPAATAQACCQPTAASGEGGAAYISGGVGEDEMNDLAAVATGYSLKLVFAEKDSGAFMSDVQVLIEDAQGGRVIEAVSNGPWFLAALKPGRYWLTVNASGVQKKQSIVIQAGQQTRMTLHFP